MSYLQTLHILKSQSCSCVAERNSTAMVVVTLKTILNEKEGYHFCQVTVVQPGWGRRAHGLLRSKRAQILLVLCINFQLLENKQEQQSYSLRRQLTDDVTDWPLPNKIIDCAAAT